MKAPFWLALLAISLATPAVLLSALGETNAEQADGATLRVRVKGARSEAGVVRILLFDGPEGYPREPAKAHRRQAARITKGEAQVVFEGLRAGTYALFAFHDEDGDSKIRSNFLGMPKEGVGASNNAKGRAGPPSFKSASIQVTGDDTTVTFGLTYL